MSRASDLLNASYELLRSALDDGEVSSLKLTEETLKRAHASNPELNAFVSILDDEALKMARVADERLKAGEKGGILGIPIAIKDLILAKGHRATAGSKILEQFVAPYDATVVTRLRAAGAPLLAKTNLDEFAMGSSNENSHFGAVKNPWKLDRVPGGSSGGSAAAVSARVTPLSLGTDTGGSIRQPSSFCGITGLKPTYGRVSRYGVVAFASSLDQVGPMCSDALSTAAVLEAISGRDVHDATSSARGVPRFVAESKSVRDLGNLSGLRIGLPKEFFDQEGLEKQVSAIVRHALDILRDRGAQLVEVELPSTKYSLPAYYLVCTSEASSNLARYDGIHFGYRSPNFKNGPLEDLYAMTRGEGFGSEVRLRILLGTYALSSGYYEAYYRKASQVRALIKKDFERAFEKCDVIAGPTSPTTAFRLGEKIDDPVAMYLADVYTLSANLAGLPGLSFNAGFDEQNLPVGIQLMSPWWQESKMLSIATLFQSLKPETLTLSPLAKKWTAGGMHS